MTTIPKPPPFPPSRIIKEGTMGSCPQCGSTEVRGGLLRFFGIGKMIGCIQPECENYYKLK